MRRILLACIFFSIVGTTYSQQQKVSTSPDTSKTKPSTGYSLHLGEQQKALDKRLEREKKARERKLKERRK